MCQECDTKREKVTEALNSGDGEAFRQAERAWWEHKCIAHLHIVPQPQQECLFELEAA
jgi:hypothetical protein